MRSAVSEDGREVIDIMNRSIYTNLLRIVGVVLVLVGIGALAGGLFAHNYVTGQLKQENITMPNQAGIDALADQKDKDALKPFIGEQMTTGTQAQAFANHYIWAHMEAAVKAAGLPEGTMYEGVGDKINEHKAALQAQGKSADEVAKDATVVSLSSLRTTLFQGNTLRAMLLTSYAFWLIGTIALVVGIALIVVGAAMAVAGFVAARGQARPLPPEPAPARSGA
ncbi:hypothetical protein [Propionibacterium cyclohexanicum]|uniref:hypothetical protein n=1 Tax=Propionibacterium cyclohexanicum TaxID=64702 RepID=UPI00115FBB26|nr:hypothetical protein [Propionibacterium cyclohexanicum]